MNEKKIAIVQNRLFKGGRIGGLWRVFKKNKLPMELWVNGDNQECFLELKNGKVVSFSFYDQQGKWQGLEALQRLKHFARKSGVRFSLSVES